MPIIGDAPPTARSHALSGGSAGQLLEKNSATDYDYSWTTPAMPGPASYTSANWYDNRVAPAANGNNGGNVGPGSCGYFPVLFTQQVSVTAVGVYPGNSGQGVSGTYYVGLLTMDPNSFKPALLLGLITTTSMSLSAFNTWTFAAPVTVPAGWNFVALGDTTDNFGATGANFNAYKVPWPVGGGLPGASTAVIAWGSGNTPIPASYPTVLANGGGTALGTVSFKVA